MKIYLFFIIIIICAIYVDSNPIPETFNTIGKAGLTAFEWMAEKFDWTLGENANVIISIFQWRWSRWSIP